MRSRPDVMHIFLLIFLISLSSLAAAEIIFPEGHPMHEIMLKSNHNKAGNCELAVDMVAVIDTTQSQLSKKGKIQQGLRDGFQLIQSKSPLSRFGLAAFTDKPIPPLGFNTTNWKDYCIDLMCDLTPSLSRVNESIGYLNIAGGMDYLEGQLEALYRAAISPKISWRRTDAEIPDNVIYQKVIVLGTDAYYHEAGDAYKAAMSDPNRTYPVPVPNDLDTHPQDLAKDVNALCSKYDYPTIEKLGKVLRDNDYIVIFYVAPSGFECPTASDGLCPWPEMVDLAKKHNNTVYAHPWEGMLKVYTDLLKQLNVTGTVQMLSTGFSGIDQALVQTAGDLAQVPWRCHQSGKSETTTLSPVTTKAVTTTPMTEPLTEPSHNHCKDNSCDHKIRIDVEVDVQ